MDGALIMNLGEMLQVASGGYLRATTPQSKNPARRRGAPLSCLFL